MSSDRTILETTLGKLLGFEDGASDVLEHLLAIESRDVGVLQPCPCPLFECIWCRRIFAEFFRFRSTGPI